MAKMTKAQARKRLEEAKQKLLNVFMSMKSPTARDVKDFSDATVAISKLVRKFD